MNEKDMAWIAISRPGTGIFGIGKKTILKILKDLNIPLNIKISDLSEEQISSISQTISKNYLIEGDLKKTIRDNIAFYKHLGTYRGKRHSLGLPVRGQQTHNNAQTAKWYNNKR